MLEEPALDRLALRSTVSDEYGIAADELHFLPLGADFNTAVYRIATKGTTAYFAKLRSGDFDRASVGVPKYLSDSGMRQVIAPIPTRSGHLWASFPPYRLILYPFIAGRDAYERKLTDVQWIEFGLALTQFHTTRFLGAITRTTRREDFSPRWRDVVRAYLARFGHETFHEPVASQLAACLHSKSRDILARVSRAEHLADALKQQPLEYILCHGDIHGWNLLVGDDGALYIVDWDTLIFASAERDLMFIGAGLGDTGRTPEQESALFYQGYSPTNVNRPAIAYYRYERIIEDIAAYCDEVLLSRSTGADRQQALENVMSNFRPGGTLQRAEEADKQSME